MTAGTVRDIRTGRALGRTKNLTQTFVWQVTALMENEVDFYIVFGRCQHKEVREMVENLRQLDYIKVIYDARMPNDTVWIFEGQPEELGFAS